MPFLLDVNVLIAQIDPRHEHHERGTRWERDIASEHLVTCPLTQNGFVRIYSHPRYRGGPGSPAEAMVELGYLLSLRTHRFMPDSLSLSDTRVFRSLAGITPKHLPPTHTCSVWRSAKASTAPRRTPGFTMKRSFAEGQAARDSAAPRLSRHRNRVIPDGVINASFR